MFLFGKAIGISHAFEDAHVGTSIDAGFWAGGVVERSCFLYPHGIDAIIGCIYNGVGYAFFTGGFVIAFEAHHENADHKPGIAHVAGGMAVAMAGYHEAIPTAGVALAFEHAIDNDASGIEENAAACGFVGGREMDEVPATVAAVGEVVVVEDVAK